jgi:hypothetical protein
MGGGGAVRSVDPDRGPRGQLIRDGNIEQGEWMLNRA